MKRAMVLCTLALVACERGRPPMPPLPPPCPAEAICLNEQKLAKAAIETTELTVASASSEIIAAGRVAFDDLRVAHVVSPLSGRLASIEVSLGQQVPKLAPLASLHAPQMGAILASAAEAEADASLARREYLREKALFAERAVAAKDFEGAENRAAQAEATAEQAAQKRALLGGRGLLAGDTYVLRAPIAGKVMTRDVALGVEISGTADAGAQAPTLFTIGSLGSVWVMGEVAAIDAAHLQPGAPATLYLTAFPERTWPSRIDWLGTTGDAGSGAVSVRCVLDNVDGLLKPGMTAELHIETAPTTGLWAPERSVFYLAGLPHVFVADREPSGALTCRKRRVQVSKRAADGRLLLADGVRAGEHVVSKRGILLTGGSL